MARKKPEAADGTKGPAADRMPTNAELLHELRLHGAKPRPRTDLPATSRRTRDFLLIAGLGSIAIVGTIAKILGDADPGASIKLAATAVAVFCGLLWFIFYGVMSRY
jgi:hypothetical protein